MNYDPRPTIPAPPNAFGIPAGIYFQISRGEFKNGHEEAVRETATFLVEVQQLGLPGVVFHGFPRELTKNWPGLAKLASDHGVKGAVSWGLDGDKDNDGTILTATEKADCMGPILVRTDCMFGLEDAEGAYETNKGPDDQSTPAKVVEMEDELRKLAPDAIIGDQPWFAIESHDAFPSSKFAKAVNFRAPQMYCNDFRGKNRCERIHDWMERDWAEHEHWLATVKGPEYVKARTITIQGYGWTDNEKDLDHLLEEYSDRPVIVYCEPLPDANVMAAIRRHVGK